MKFLYGEIPVMRQQFPTSVFGDRVSQFEKNLFQTIPIVIETYPKLINQPDFKRQTPLMFAANNGDAHTLSLLMNAGADLECQDFRGRTAITAAVASRSLECFNSLKGHKQFPRMVKALSANGANVLHTAVRAGLFDAVEYLADQYPELLVQADDEGRTPLDLAKLFSSDKAEHNHYKVQMRKEGREVGDYAEFLAVSEFLTQKVT
jgi:ankyrin repeat protein